MTLTEAARLLEIAPDATPDQLEKRFLELRARLEDKIAKAPTPGLQAKYRTSLAQITEAFESLTLAADSSTLPVLQRVQPAAADSSRPAASVAPAAPVRSSPKKKSGNKEFILVAVIAVAVLGAGGWWVVKSRADHAEKVRLEALAKLEAEEKRAAEIAAAEAEKQRLETLNASLRSGLAVARTEWASLEDQVQMAERNLADLKSDYRDARDKSPAIRAELAARVANLKQTTEGLRSHLGSHSAKTLLAKLDALIGARALDDAIALNEQLSEALTDAGLTVRMSLESAHRVKAPTDFRSTPAGLDWIVRSHFDGDNVVEITGKTPLKPDGWIEQFIGRGRATVIIRRPGWPNFEKEIEIDTHEGVAVEAQFPGGKARLTAVPAEVDWELIDGSGRKRTGKTPIVVDDVAPGAATVIFRRPGFKEIAREINVKVNETVAAQAELRSQVLKITVAEPEAEIWINDKFIGRKEVTFTDQPPGTHRLELRHPKWARYRTELVVKQEYTTGTRAFSFAELTTPSVTCDNCRGQGFHNRAKRCNTCKGTTHVDCDHCRGGTRYPEPGTGFPPIPCTTCDARGRLRCNECDRGTYRWSETCTRCKGGGKLSKLFLNQ